MFLFVSLVCVLIGSFFHQFHLYNFVGCYCCFAAIQRLITYSCQFRHKQMAHATRSHIYTHTRARTRAHEHKQLQISNLCAFSLWLENCFYSYHSASTHTHNFSIPTRVIIIHKAKIVWDCEQGTKVNTRSHFHSVSSLSFLCGIVVVFALQSYIARYTNSVVGIQFSEWGEEGGWVVWFGAFGSAHNLDGEKPKLIVTEDRQNNSRRVDIAGMQKS